MRFKYKKIILFITLAIMLIGMGTFSLIAPNVNFSIGSNVTSQTSTGSALSVMSDLYLAGTGSDDDMDELKKCVSDASHVEEKRLISDAEYIEDYKNIECMILNKGLREGLYRVYVYCEAKIYDIDTLVPSLAALVVAMNDEGEFVISFSPVENEDLKAIHELDDSAAVKKLISTVQKKLQDIVSKNADVRDFYQMLESSDSESAVENNENINQEASQAGQTPATQ